MQNSKSAWSANLRLQSIEGEKTFVLPTDRETTLGREPDCQIVVDSTHSSSVSRYHARIEPILDNSSCEWHIHDLKSSNGTYINGVRLQGRKVLQPGDRVMLSKDGIEFLFDCQEEVILQAVVDEEPLTKVLPSASPPESHIAAQPTVPSSPQKPDSLLPTSSALTNSATSINAKLIRTLWDLAADKFYCALPGHSDSVRAIAFSPDGERLASTSSDKTVKLWSLSTNEEIQTFDGHKLIINALAFSPNDQIFASGSADKTIKLWDLKTGQDIQTLTGHGRGVSAVSFNLDGMMLASGGEDKLIKVWNLKAEEVIQSISGHKMSVTSVTFSPNGQILASGGADRVVKLWQLETGAEILTLPVFRASIDQLLFSPDGNSLAIACDDGAIRLWNLELEQEVRVLPSQPWQCGRVAISLDGQKLASGCKDNTIRVWPV